VGGELFVFRGESGDFGLCFGFSQCCFAECLLSSGLVVLVIEERRLIVVQPDADGTVLLELVQPLVGDRGLILQMREDRGDLSEKRGFISLPDIFLCDKDTQDA